MRDAGDVRAGEGVLPQSRRYACGEECQRDALSRGVGGAEIGVVPGGAWRLPRGIACLERQYSRNSWRCRKKPLPLFPRRRESSVVQKDTGSPPSRGRRLMDVCRQESINPSPRPYSLYSPTSYTSPAIRACSAAPVASTTRGAWPILRRKR